MAIDKKEARNWHRKIRDVLNRDWDPIGGCPDDEYESYAGKIAAMIRDPRQTNSSWPIWNGPRLSTWGWGGHSTKNEPGRW